MHMRNDVGHFGYLGLHCFPCSGHAIAGCACRYRKGLPPTVMRMNEECLRLRPHDHPGYQTVQEIRAIVSQAIGPIQHQHHKPRDGLESLVDHLALDDSQYF